jgi:hypothetical protein
MNHAGYRIAAIALLFGASNGIPAAQAETIQLKADLKGANEVPPNASPASGKAVATLDTDTRLLTSHRARSRCSFSWPQRIREKRWYRVAVQDRAKPDRRDGNTDGEPGGRPALG